MLQIAGPHSPPCPTADITYPADNRQGPSTCPTADFSHPAVSWTHFPPCETADFTHLTETTGWFLKTFSLRLTVESTD